MISNILSNNALFIEQIWAKNSKNTKNVVSLFPEGNKKQKNGFLER